MAKPIEIGCLVVFVGGENIDRVGEVISGPDVCDCGRCHRAWEVRLPSPGIGFDGMHKRKDILEGWAPEYMIRRIDGPDGDAETNESLPLTTAVC